MSSTEIMASNAFDKARVGLWTSLQKHLLIVYEAEQVFLKATAFADFFPFTASLVEEDQLQEYWKCRNKLRDLYSDETAQLDTLVKAIRTKSYSEEGKKQLYLLILGYMDIVSIVFELLSTRVPTKLATEEELAETNVKFDRVRRFARLNIKGIINLLAPPIP
ncbi:hypothetical protein [Hymenobacter sp. GOD-10R]|uniref:hypothetical protein n=1 Tax=Hymenobacter sp. GOD-10R TaxID=3093922 RepID=UPI002D7715F0|nr:hypothetical protein [Hymenobacter sp. GOD-10R]WRQ28116.1 hypothetical protein SD425_23920 [Hymenobacter sp. GOD-10R]